MLVSVLMMTYNHEAYIIPAIKSVLNQQANFEFELVIGNDSSSDSSNELIQSYIKSVNEHKLQSYYHNINIGMIENFKFLYKKAKGQYIAICEGDDYWTDPLKLQKQVDFLEANPNYSFCWTRFKTLNQQTQELRIDLNSNFFLDDTEVFTFDFEAFNNGWHIGNLTLVYRKDFLDIENYNRFKYFRDVHVITQLLKKGKGACLNFVSAVYRIHEGGVHSRQSQYQVVETGYKVYREIYLDNEDNIYLKQKYIRLLKSYIEANITERFLFKALKESIRLVFLDRSLLNFAKYQRRIFIQFIKVQ